MFKLNYFNIILTHKRLQKLLPLLVLLCLTVASITTFFVYYINGLGLSYNDARSHLNIARRVVEGLKPGLAQIGSVWLPLPHLLMLTTIWNDFMWHSGLSGSLLSMVSYVVCGMAIYMFLKELGAGVIGCLTGVAIFALNLNILYLQSTAMTELLLLATLTLAALELFRWVKTDNLLPLLYTAFWTMMASLIRYEGWFLLIVIALFIIIHTLKKKGYVTAEGTVILFSTLAAFGIGLWFLWNLLIFKDPLYFIFGPFSARTQQQQLEKAGELVTKNNLPLSIKVYSLATAYNATAFILILGIAGLIIFYYNKKIPIHLKLASSALLAPFVFNILALFLGHSVLFLQGISGNTWFNVRYGVMVLPAVAIFTGYLIHKARPLRLTLIGLIFFVLFFAYANGDIVTVDDARVGSSQKNVTEVSGYLAKYAKNQPGFVLISAASHDAIIFSSGLPMKKFIHEGTGLYWEYATTMPEKWARWIVMRTYDDNDLTWKAISKTNSLNKYTLVAKYPFADVYELKQEYLPQLVTEPILGKQK